ncbi:MAG: hypothetical protein GYA24_04840 [Candidatus Lokiarchaeota archaeon]|nr:hypothetical protein [Candidatus Lokiarchaeota archaeon]
MKRGVLDNLNTWKVGCVKQNCERDNNHFLDIFQLRCEHTDPFDPTNRESKILDKEKSKKTPITVTEGSIFLPVTDRCIDIGETKDIDVEDLEYVLLGFQTRQFHKILNNPDLSLKVLREYIISGKNPTLRTILFSTPDYMGLSAERKEAKFKDTFKIGEIQSIISQLKAKFSLESLQEVNDFSALLGRYDEVPVKPSIHDIPKARKYIDYINSLPEGIKRNVKADGLSSIKSKFGIEDIIHLPDVGMLLSCYGMYNGFNKFYQDGFVPHFEPIWSGFRSRASFEAYVYPYTTEGILFCMNKRKVVDWLVANKLITDAPQSDDELFEFFIQLANQEKPREAIEFLLHTFSHLLISRASIYTGIDEQSCSEMVFPSTNAFFIYATSNINIGGFQYVFEHEMENWFESILYDVRECTTDPNCIHEKGACFACLYLPEFVCTDFNRHLDRDVFLGKFRYSKGFWST